MVRLLLIHSLILFTFIADCSHKTIIKSENDSGGKCTMKPGDTLQVVLKSNPSTGYQWEIAAMDTTILKSIDKQYIPDKAPKHTTGSGGKSIFRFTGIKKGESNLRLIYDRPFEEGVAPIKTFKMMVQVR